MLFVRIWPCVLVGWLFVFVFESLSSSDIIQAHNTGLGKRISELCMSGSVGCNDWPPVYRHTDQATEAWDRSGARTHARTHAGTHDSGFARGPRGLPSRGDAKVAAGEVRHDAARLPHQQHARGRVPRVQVGLKIS